MIAKYFLNVLKDIDDEVADLLKVTARLLDTKVAEMLTNVEEASLIIKLIKFVTILASQILKHFPHVIDGASFSIFTGDYRRSFIGIPLGNMKFSSISELLAVFFLFGYFTYVLIRCCGALVCKTVFHRSMSVC